MPRASAAAATLGALLLLAACVPAASARALAEVDTDADVVAAAPAPAPADADAPGPAPAEVGDDVSVDSGAALRAGDDYGSWCYTGTCTVDPHPCKCYNGCVFCPGGPRKLLKV